MTYKLGIIGAGVMGQAILNCVIDKKYLNKEQIAVFDVSDEKRNEIKSKGITVFGSANELAKNCEYILIAIKPQHFDGLSKDITISENNVIVSIMAGVKIGTIRKKLRTDCGIARVMPNTPCKIGKGVCAVVTDKASEENKSFVFGLLGCCGEVVPVEESLFDTVTSVSGSGPAYVYMFIDGMIKGGMNGGLTYEQSKKLAIQTVIGSAMLAESSEEKADSLTEKVCSKGGTTIEAVKIYREKGLEDLIQEGMEACRKRSEEMSKA